MFVHRPIVTTRGGLVVAGHHLAAEAGARMLRAGGNAMDAAVAAAATLAVAIPHMNGLGGDVFALWFDRTAGRVSCLNGSGRAPAAATRDLYRARGLDAVPLRGPLSISVPGAVHAWGLAVERFGRLPLSTVLTPAVALAADGLPIDRQLRDFLASPLYAELAASFPRLAALFGPPGARHLGAELRQPALADTLARIAEQGTRALYGGDVGRRLVADTRAAGALLGEEDLARHATDVADPLSVDYRGARVFAAPPNSQGLALVLMLALREAEGEAVPGDPGRFLGRLLGWKRVAFEIRDRLVGDPAVARIPATLLEDAARGKLAEDLGPGPRWLRGGGDTTTLVAVDRWGNAVSWAQSLFEEFGSGIVSEATGIVLHNRLHLATLTGDHPNTLSPGRRPFHTLCPALVVTAGRCELAIATPGDHGQPQTLAQVIIALWERGVDVQEAIEAPRIRHEHGQEVLYESRLDAAAVAALEASGHAPRDVGPWSRLMGGVNAIHLVDGRWMGGADPRRASYAVAE